MRYNRKLVIQKSQCSHCPVACWMQRQLPKGEPNAGFFNIAIDLPSEYTISYGQ